MRVPRKMKRTTTDSDNDDDDDCAYALYLLESDDRERTYVGIAKDVARRIRQHNGEIKGGARSTRTKLHLKIACIVRGFESDKKTRQIEKKMHRTRVYGVFKTPLQRRVNALNRILSCSGSEQQIRIYVSTYCMEEFRLLSWPKNVVTLIE